MPADVTTVEFLRDVARVLRPDGVFVANVADGPPVTYSPRLAAGLADGVRRGAGPRQPVPAQAAPVRQRRPGRRGVRRADRGHPRAAARAMFPQSVLSGADVRRFIGGAAPLTDAERAALAGAAGRAVACRRVTHRATRLRGSRHGRWRRCTQNRTRAESFGVGRRATTSGTARRTRRARRRPAWRSARATVLDVGCGTGKAARLLAARGSDVLGVEIDREMAEVARSHGLTVEVASFEGVGRGTAARSTCWPAAQAWHWVDPDARRAEGGAGGAARRERGAVLERRPARRRGARPGSRGGLPRARAGTGRRAAPDATGRAT